MSGLLHAALHRLHEVSSRAIRDWLVYADLLKMSHCYCYKKILLRLTNKVSDSMLDILVINNNSLNCITIYNRNRYS